MMAKEILGLSANGYSVVQARATSSGAEMLDFGLGQGYSGRLSPLGGGGVCAAEGLTRLWGLWPISRISKVVQQSRMIRAVRVPILPRVNDHLVQERLKRWYPE